MPETVNTVRSWSSDQEWHRGGFSLYIEQEGQGKAVIAERLADLLAPTPEVLETYEAKDLRDTEALLQMLTRYLTLPQDAPDLSALGRELYEMLAAWAPHAAEKGLEEAVSNPWLEKVMPQVDRIAEGRSV